MKRLMIQIGKKGQYKTTILRNWENGILVFNLGAHYEIKHRPGSPKGGNANPNKENNNGAHLLKYATRFPAVNP
ncbi:hypothetical protein AYI68_g3654 [Smittium mucronatum]|uniref:Uncharacterized protein n=1 Tax=Smittium mucronatum TaxID=133383 RepID=A0A1R0GZA9_9FUNG|nr:hypothetical protein AYI68_g3654 [Smittium mucronatum]